jgi:hypothetical protein
VDINREFFDKFGKIVEKDAAWAYRVRGDHDRQCKDPFDFYLEVQEREATFVSDLPTRPSCAGCSRLRT